MSYILAYIAIILFTIVYILDGFIILLFKVKDRKWYKLTSKKSRSKAFKTDVIANWLFPDTWAFLFSCKIGYKFGRFGESLSSCIGRKYQDNSLSYFGLFFYWLLYLIDFTAWGKGGHCITSIMSDEEINNFTNTNSNNN